MYQATHGLLLVDKGLGRSWGWLMHNPQRASELAKFLAPVLKQAGDVAAEPGSPEDCSCREKMAAPAEPAVDVAIGLELHEVWKKAVSPQEQAGEQATGELSDRLTEVLEGDEHAVEVLWALLAGGGDRPRADALPELLAAWAAGGSPPSGSSAPGGRKASDGGGRPPGLSHKTADSLRRIWVSVCMNAIVALVLVLAWWLAWPPLQVRPQAGALSLEVFAVWSLSFLPGWLYIRFLGQRAGALWDEYVLNLHRLRWSIPRHLPNTPVISVYYPVSLGE